MVNARSFLLSSFIILSVTILSACTDDQWFGFVYPNKDNLSNDTSIGVFSSLEKCRKAALNTIQSNKYVNGDYECGLDCDLSKGKPYICKNTSR